MQIMSDLQSILYKPETLRPVSTILAEIEAVDKQLSRYLSTDFAKVFSIVNLRNFRQFYRTFPDVGKGYALRSLLSWSHYRLIMREKTFGAAGVLSSIRIVIPAKAGIQWLNGLAPDLCEVLP